MTKVLKMHNRYQKAFEEGRTQIKMCVRFPDRESDKKRKTCLNFLVFGEK